MKNLKLGIIACGILGLATVFIGSQALWKAHELPGVAKHLYMIIGGFGVAAVMGVLGAVSPPLKRWQAGVATAGFALVLLKVRDGLFQGSFFNGKMLSLAVLVGLALAIVSIVKPEQS